MKKFNILTKVSEVPSLRGRARERVNKKPAFTLAEVLITIGVIGVVSALTMPTLIKHYQQHETVNRLKETYSIIYNAIRMSETQNGLLETWNIPNPGWNENTYTYGITFFNEYLKPYIKITKECKYLSNECWADAYTLINGRGENDYFPASKNRTYGMILANGSVIGFYPRGTLCEIYIDLNGKKGPNKLGKDLFDLLIIKNSINNEYIKVNKSGLYMAGSGIERNELTSNNKRGCSKSTASLSGMFCGALIMHDGWKIDKNYPW